MKRLTNKCLERQEAEANAFAMGLLMPEEWVKREVDRVGGFDIVNGENVKSLAKKFGVSETMMALRLGQIYSLFK